VLAGGRSAIRQRDESLEKLRAGIDEWKQKTAGLQRAADERERLLTELQARLDRARDEAEIIRFEAESRRVEDAEQRRALTEELKTAWTAVAARMAELKAARAEHAARLDRLTGERDALRGELARSGETLARAEARLRAMEESTSWRVTAPMRAVSGRLRRAGAEDEG